jgi:hypothetical protein
LEKTRSSIDHEAGSATKLEISNPKSETPSGPSSVGDAKNRPGRRDLLIFSMRPPDLGGATDLVEEPGSFGGDLGLAIADEAAGVHGRSNIRDERAERGLAARRAI